MAVLGAEFALPALSVSVLLFVCAGYEDDRDGKGVQRLRRAKDWLLGLLLLLLVGRLMRD